MNGEFNDEVEKLKVEIEKMEEFDNFNQFKKELMSRSGLKGKKFFKPLRIILTGEENGPELSLLYPLLKGYLKQII